MRLFSLKYTVAILTLLFASGCALRPAESDDLTRIKGVGISNDSALAVSGIRHACLRDTALCVGARAGLASRAAEINKELLKEGSSLSRIFNFYAMMLDNNVMPPVLIEGRTSLTQTEDESLRIADRTYILYSQAYFITAPPTWQDYLLFHCEIPEIPDRSLLPKSEIEKRVWDRYIDDGWMAGRAQANAIFLENLGRLKRDYQGMILYRTLLAQNMVTPPFVAKLDLGITGNDHELTIHDRILRITAQPVFQLDSRKWEAEMIVNKQKPHYRLNPCELENCVKNARS